MDPEAVRAPAPRPHAPRPVLLALLAPAVLASPPQGGPPPVTEFVCNADVVWEGAQALDHLGSTLAVGDWTGDGQPEFLVGTTGKWDPEPPSLKGRGGSACLLSGALAGWGGAAPSLVALDIQGPEADDRFGWSVAFVDDLNPYPGAAANLPGFHDLPGTPRMDFAVGNPRGRTVGKGVWDRCGEVYLFLSTAFDPALPAGFPHTPASAPTVVVPDAASAASLIVRGATPNGRFGYALSPAGDWDADGVPDLAVGAPGGLADDASPGGLEVKGRVWILSGAKLAQRAAAVHVDGSLPKVVSVLEVLTPLQPAPSTERLDRYGMSLALLGDTNGNGRDELAVGAPGLYYNGLGGPLETPGVDQVGVGYVDVLSPGLARRRIRPDEAQPAVHAAATGAPQAANAIGFGRSLAGVDVSGDGRAELIVAAPWWDLYDPRASGRSLRDTGRVWVIALPVATQWPKASVATAPIGTSVGLLELRDGLEEDALFGYTVGALGLRDHPTLPGVAIRTYGVGSHAASTKTSPTACPGNTSNHAVPPGALAAAGGYGAGVLTVYAYRYGALRRYVGEDVRDSASWCFASVGDVTGSWQEDLVITAPRWPYAPIGSGPGMLKELGRVYFFEGR